MHTVGLLVCDNRVFGGSGHQLAIAPRVFGNPSPTQIQPAYPSGHCCRVVNDIALQCRINTGKSTRIVGVALRLARAGGAAIIALQIQAPLRTLITGHLLTIAQQTSDHQQPGITKYPGGLHLGLSGEQCFNRAGVRGGLDQMQLSNITCPPVYIKAPIPVWIVQWSSKYPRLPPPGSSKYQPGYM